MFNTQQTGSLFGGTSTSGSLFGTATQQQLSSFPTATTTTNSLFGSQQPATSGNLFGAKQPTTGSLFGMTTTQAQPTTGGGLFGQQQPAAAATGFGAGGGLFGTNKPATSAFGQVSQPQTSIFGQPQQTVAGGLFGSTAPSTATFGPTTTTTSSIFGTGATQSYGFGQQQQQPQAGGGLFGPKPAQQTFGTTFGVATTQQTTGTNVVKFAAPTGSDTMQLKGSQQTVPTKQMCISGMKEYESRSLEELRVADYLAGRKVNTSAPTGTTLFGQQQQGTGLFGQGLAKPGGGIFTGATTSASAFPTATTTTNSLFGQQGASGSLFGPAKPAGSLFGQTTSQPQQQTAGIFGQQQPAVSAAFNTGGLFKPATSAFGQVSQPQQSLFGQQQSTGIFGNAPAAPFGATTTTTTGMFGNTATPFGPQQPQAQSIFAKPATQPSFGPFGATQPATAFGGGATGGSIFGAGAAASKIGGGIFGNQPQPQATSNIFSNNLMQKPAGQTLFGQASAGQAGGGIFGQTPSYGLQQQNVTGSPPILLGSNVNVAGIQQAIIDAQLSTLPYGDSPLLKSPVSPRKSPQDISNLQRQLHLGTHRKAYDELLVSPTNGTLTSDLTATSPPKPSDNEPAKDTTPSFNGSLLDSSFNYKPMVRLPSVGFGAALGLSQSPKLIKSKTSEKSLLSDKSSFLVRSLPEEDTSSRRVKSLDMSVVLDQSNNDSTGLFLPPETPPQQRLAVTEASPLRLITPNISGSEEFPQPQFPQPQIPPTQLSPSPPQHEQIKQTQPIIKPTTPPPPHKKYKIKLTRPEYYAEPPVEDLETMFNEEGICRLEGGLTVGRLGYGSVFWKGPLELEEPVDLDEIVHFRNKEVVVYPDETKKPDIGNALNRPAEVSLERIWPINPKTREMIKDPDELRRIGFREKLERLSQRMDAVFRDYQPGTGTWQFEVQHFSKYGFLDDDEEAAAMETSTANSHEHQLKQQAHLQTLVQKAKVPLREIQKTLEGTGQPTALQKAPTGNTIIDASTEKMGTSKRILSKDEEEEAELYEDAMMDNKITAEYMMDFNEDTKQFQEEVIRKRFRLDDTLFDSSKLLKYMVGREEDMVKIPQTRQLVERLPKNVFKGLSKLNITNSVLARAGIQIERRSCRTGFTKGIIFTGLTQGAHLTTVNIYQATVIPTLKHYLMRFAKSQESVDEQQSIRKLESSELINFEPPSPILLFLDEFIRKSHQRGKEGIEEDILKACAIILMKTDTIEEKIFQRKRMGNWLRLQLETNRPQQKSSLFAIVFHYLINGAIHKAIDAARQAHHYNLALLLSLYKTPASTLIREQAERQLTLMSKRTSDPDYMKIFQLLSGHWEKSSVKGSCLEGLNWLQILGLIIWYHALPTTTLVECLDSLENLMSI